MENNKLIETLHNDIIVIPGQDANDTLLYALKLLHSLTKNINERMYTILKNEVISFRNVWYYYMYRYIFVKLLDLAYYVLYQKYSDGFVFLKELFIVDF